ncbi:MAG: transposase [Patescibacteria group bacterium]|nr:transposase [Patescibacteria group bacterium]
MRKTFQYRLFPTKAQETILNAQLEECRWVYNHFLEERKTTYERTKKAPGLYDQQKTIPTLKEQRPSLKTVHSQVLQNVTVRIDLAFQAFFRRVKAGEKPGYPRFRGRGRYDSMTFPQAPSGCSLDCDILTLAKVGAIQVVLHRKMLGTPKTCTIKRSSTGKWYASFSCEVVQPKPLKRSREQVGIDVGLTTFATLSTGESVDNPRFFRADEKALARAQRRLSKEAKGTPERIRRRKPIARIHERIAFRRKDFAHQTARKLVDRFGFLAVEDLEVNHMVHNRCLAKSISDVAWSLFFTLLFFKAASAGRTIVRVNPAYTSQDCSRCGHRQKMPLSKREFRCSCCQSVLNRDHNASLNILRLGLQSVGIQSLEAAAL